MVATILHLDEGAGALGEAGDEVRRGLAHRHDVGDNDLNLSRHPSESWDLIAFFGLGKRTGRFQLALE